jgi:hypothetical protein
MDSSRENFVHRIRLNGTSMLLLKKNIEIYKRHKNRFLASLTRKQYNSDYKVEIIYTLLHIGINEEIYINKNLLYDIGHIHKIDWVDELLKIIDNYFTTIHEIISQDINTSDYDSIMDYIKTIYDECLNKQFPNNKVIENRKDKISKEINRVINILLSTTTRLLTFIERDEKTKTKSNSKPLGTRFGGSKRKTRKHKK